MTEKGVVPCGFQPWCVWDVWGGCLGCVGWVYFVESPVGLCDKFVLPESLRLGRCGFCSQETKHVTACAPGDLPAPPSHTPLLLPFLSQDVLAYLAHKDADEVPLTPTPTQYLIQPPGRALACTPEEQPRLPHPGAMSSPQWFNGQS